MKSNLLFALIAAALLAPSAASAMGCDSSCDQIVGDVDGDGYVGYNDVSTLYRWLYVGGAKGICQDVADVNGDGSIDLSDAYYLGHFVWSGGPAPVSPSVPGDVNDDGDVDIADLVTLGQWLWGSVGDVCAVNADVNDDGGVDITDFTVLAHML